MDLDTTDLEVVSGGELKPLRADPVVSCLDLCEVSRFQLNVPNMKTKGTEVTFALIDWATALKFKNAVCIVNPEQTLCMHGDRRVADLLELHCGRE